MSTLIVVVISVAAALAVGLAIGRARAEKRAGIAAAPPLPAATVEASAATMAAADQGAATERPAAADRAAEPDGSEATARPAAADRAPTPDEAAPLSPAPADTGAIAERARIIRAYEAETAALRRALAARDASASRLEAFADDRARLFAELAQARGETARYRQLVVDLEDSAPPPLLDSSAPDDLKLIVGIGPVLERMLHQLGIGAYRQIARWSERDIDDFDAKLHEFRGRIRRDSWVAQARALHQSKYGETLAPRERW